MKLAPATPEIPVADVVKAQEHYRDVLGFDIAWLHASGEIGAVSHGECALFLRLTAGDITPMRVWIFVDDVDAAYEKMVSAGASIEEPIEDKPWNIRQFTLRDRDGNRIVMHHDL